MLDSRAYPLFVYEHSYWLSLRFAMIDIIEEYAMPSYTILCSRLNKKCKAYYSFIGERISPKNQKEMK